jgi:hypothetical protein
VQLYIVSLEFFEEPLLSTFKMLRTTFIATKCLQYTVKSLPRTTFIQLRNYVQEQKHDSPKTQKEKTGSFSTEPENTPTQKEKKFGLDDVATLVVIGAFVAAIVIVFKETEFPQGQGLTSRRFS